MFKTLKPARLTLAAVVLSLFGSVQIALAEAPSDDTAVFDAGKKRVHVADCKRYKKAEDKSIYETKTYGDAKADGKDLCSRCPGSPNAKE